ncbi:MAG: hypothetical protein J5563_00545 [Clostridia bacterium]|nr:hypothetical protein [Clostridia bacterium]
MKKIICLLLAVFMVFTFISCNREKNPMNTEESKTTTESTTSKDTVPIEDIKIFDFNEREKGENIYITLDDLKKLYEEAESIYREYDIVRGKVQKHTYPLLYETYAGEPKFEYYDIEIVPNHDIIKKIDKLDSTLNRKEAGNCYSDICLIFMMNITSFCKEGMVLSEYDKNGCAWTHGSGIAKTYWYSILLFSEIIPYEPKEIYRGNDVLFITRLVDDGDLKPLMPTIRLREEGDKSTHVIEFHDGLRTYLYTLEE